MRTDALWRCDRSEHGVAQLDDLNELTACDPELLADLFENHQMVPARNGMTKAAAQAYMSVRGLGKQTWNYVMMLLGVPGVKADTMVCRYVNAAVAPDRPRGPEQCGALVIAAAEELAADPIQLDHAIWLYQRAQ